MQCWENCLVFFIFDPFSCKNIKKTQNKQSTTKLLEILYFFFYSGQGLFSSFLKKLPKTKKNNHLQNQKSCFCEQQNQFLNSVFLNSWGSRA